ncbi:potassium-transporting ATPase subunit KdpC [Novosphingobium acidiphilum]|uniref:potassium-transporting ATPase subunit KdpC n=1 Tax=Novosphingobium acidiphilum TaxID=505248 RepID=UPI000429F8D1|nr:potassium-transporting ATPase subunit KdpC [Novosphingobium acidiphilum]
MLNDLAKAFRPALVLTVLLFVLTGLVYPLTMTGLAQALFPHAANGSLIRRDGHVIGSALIGQAFAAPGYFHPRLSAAGKGYDPTQSGGSNLGPTSKALIDRVSADVRANPGAPADLLTTSASGLDPDITPEAAEWQVPRVAAARHLAPARVNALVQNAIRAPLLGLIGEPRVNVLTLNLALDKLAGKGAQHVS